MLYVTIVACLLLLCTDENSIWFYVFFAISILCFLCFLALCFLTDDNIMFEKHKEFGWTQEKIKLIYSLDMSMQKPSKYFIIPQKDDAYHLYVKTETGFERTEYDIEKIELKQCNEKYPNACVVETVETAVYQFTPRYKKFLYYGVVFYESANKYKHTRRIEKKTTYTLYVPQNTIVQ